MRLLLLLFFAGTVFAQEPGKTWRVGFLSPVGGQASEGLFSAFGGYMRALGYVEGRNLTIEHRWPASTLEQEPAVAEALVQSKVDAIVAWATSATVAARRATSTIPIVFLGNSDPVGSGMVRSLARPGGNVTGVSNIGADIAAKQVELIVELLPGTKRIGIIANKSNPAFTVLFKEVDRAIGALGLQSDVMQASSSEDFAHAFRELARNKANAVLLLPDPSLIQNRKQIGDLALKSRLPTFFQREENVRAGGLMSYGPNLNDQLRQVARLVDKILKGAKPADLPVEQAERIEMVLNATTAKTLGIKVPASIQFRAQVVE